MAPGHRHFLQLLQLRLATASPRQLRPGQLRLACLGEAVRVMGRLVGCVRHISS